MLRSCLRSTTGASGRLHHHPACAPIARRTPLCQVPTPPRPRPLPIVLSRCNSTSRPPPRPPRPDEKASSSSSDDQSYGQKLNRAWSTPTKWYPIPIALGALVLLAVQFRKEQRGSDEVTVDAQREGAVVRSSKIDGPWQVRVLGALPLRSLSQLWGYLNSLVLPMWFRPFGFKLYARIFGCNLDEMAEQDLTKYESLGEFFYRELRDGVRPIAACPMVSPADGRVLHFGEIRGEQVEQVKGITYSLTALLGTEESASETTEIDLGRSHAQVVDDKNFAHINDIPYSLSKLLGKSTDGASIPSKLDRALPKTPMEQEVDASHPPANSDFAHDVNVALELGSGAVSPATDRSGEIPRLSEAHKLFFLVVYLAPGDYHRFHSPATWVVERRRHFTGDLFSVSPYIANRLKNLFVLNERVALLGRWKYGFFSMVPVGATNVGSIRVNFDEALRTNTNDGDTKKEPHTFSEAVYSSASVLRGQPLLTGEEMGGFRLGSTIVMVFEAPKDWEFTVNAGEKIKVGEPLGRFRSEASDGKKSAGGVKVSIGKKS